MDIIVVRCRDRAQEDGEIRHRCRSCRVMVWVNAEQSSEKDDHEGVRFICTVCAG